MTAEIQLDNAHVTVSYYDTETQTYLVGLTLVGIIPDKLQEIKDKIRPFVGDWQPALERKDIPITVILRMDI